LYFGKNKFYRIDSRIPLKIKSTADVLTLKKHFFS
jgi:hypothetical protein